MLTVTKDLVLPTTITGSYPKPNWYTQNLQTRPFKVAMGDSLFREQYLDAVAGILTEQSWIVNLIDRVLEVYRDPVLDASARYGWRYRSVQILTPPVAIAPLAMLSTPILVADLLP